MNSATRNMTAHAWRNAGKPAGLFRRMKDTRRKVRYCALSLLLCALTTACADEVESLYANIRAFFRFSPVTQVPGLRAALNSPGMFCTISFSNGKYIFDTGDGNPFVYTPTAIDQYGTPECVSGFIVGMPNIPDLNGNFYNIAFDLVCPNCYSTDAVQRSLTLQSTDAVCGRCKRHYGLNNGGIVTAGKGGRGLYRYPVTYNSGTDLLLIRN